MQAASLPPGRRRYHTATFDVRTDQPSAAPLLLAPPDAVLVLDGVFLLRPQLNDAWDLRTFLEVSFQETLRRAVARDRVLFGSAQATQELPAALHPRPAPLPRHRATQRIADVVIDNHGPATPKLASILRVGAELIGAG
jgi:uridine kinase